MKNILDNKLAMFGILVVVAVAFFGVASIDFGNKTENYLPAYQTRLNQVIAPIAVKGMKAKYDAAIDTLEAIKADNHAHEIDPVPLNALFDEKTKELLALKSKLLEKEIDEFVKGTNYSLQKAYGLSDALLEIDSDLKTHKFQPIPETTKTNLADYTKLCEKVNYCVGVMTGDVKKDAPETIKTFNNDFDKQIKAINSIAQKEALQNYNDLARYKNNANVNGFEDVFKYILQINTAKANDLKNFWSSQAITLYIKPRTK